MNKFCLIFASVVCLSFFSSCGNESENHSLYVVYPNPYKILFADQVEDSLIFETFDSYEAISSQPEWITITAGASHSVNYDPRNLYSFKTLLAFTQNTTGKTRVGAVRVNSYEYSSAGIYYQLGCMNINNPAPKYVYFDNAYSYIPEYVTFELQVAADSESDSICFTVSQPWTLEFAPDVDKTWASIEKTDGQKGHNNIAVSLTPYTDKENARSTALVLKSGEVSNVINIKQMPAKEEEND